MRHGYESLVRRLAQRGHLRLQESQRPMMGEALDAAGARLRAACEGPPQFDGVASASVRLRPRMRAR